MGCERYDAPGVTLFVCGRESRVSCSCGHATSARCGYALRGRLEGQTCGRPICVSCSAFVDSRDMCLVHARLKEGR